MRRVGFLVGFLLLAAPAVSCGPAKTVVTPSPSAADVAAFRADLKHVADNLTTVAHVLDSAASLANNHDLDVALIAVVGTHDKPGPLPAALTALKSVNDAPGVKTILKPLIAQLQPLVTQITANPKTASLGIVLTSLLAFVTTYANS